MRKWAGLTRAHPWIGTAATLGLFSIAWLVIANIPLSYDDDVIGDVAELHDWFRDQQLTFLLLYPPRDEPFLQVGCPDVLPYDPAGFPKEFLKGLPGDIEHDVPIYTVYLVEDAASRAFVIFNRDDDEPIWSVPPPADYDPYAYAKERFPGLETGIYSPEAAERILSALDPARLQIMVRLVPEDFYANYVAAREAELSALLWEMGGGMAMMMSGDPSNLWVSARGPSEGLTNQVEVTVHLPEGFTNCVDVFVFDADAAAYEGLNSVWLLVASNLTAGASNEVLWSDSAVTSVVHRFYAAGDADTDADDDA